MYLFSVYSKLPATSHLINLLKKSSVHSTRLYLVCKILCFFDIGYCRLYSSSSNDWFCVISGNIACSKHVTSSLHYLRVRRHYSNTPSRLTLHPPLRKLPSLLPVCFFPFPPFAVPFPSLGWLGFNGAFSTGLVKILKKTITNWKYIRIQHKSMRN